MADLTTHAPARWPVIGHEWAVDHLARALRHGRTRHAYLFTGPSRIGKTRLALAFAAALNCTGETPPCGECRACKLTLKAAHPDLTIINSGQEGGSLKIDDVRELQQVLSLRPYEGRYRIAILRRFHEATDQAEDALLKTLEEPAPRAVLLLTASAPDALRPTIVSRCQPMHLRPLPIELVRAALERERGVDPDTAQALAQLSAGRIGWALAACEDPAERATRDEAIEILLTALQGTRRERFARVEKIAFDKPTLLAWLDYWQGFWRDVLLVACGSQATIINADHEADIRALAERAGRDAAQRALESTRMTIGYLNRNVNTRLALEVLMLDYPPAG
ncbi:MAG: DNA polymerase III subunit [Chloroflexi bacterium]|nr:DNA polymerase III subunit [Chloroflexota bacterium]